MYLNSLKIIESDKKIIFYFWYFFECTKLGIPKAKYYINKKYFHESFKHPFQLCFSTEESLSVIMVHYSHHS